MRRRELITICCVAALGLAMTGCNSTTAGTDTAVSDSKETESTSVSGRITEIDGTQVTVQTGGQNQNTPPEKPDSNGNDSGDNGNQNQDTPPEKPDGDGNGNGDNGNQNQSTLPEKPDGDSNDNSDQSQSTPPEKPDGDGNDNGGETGETRTFDFSTCTIYKDGEEITIEDLQENDQITITLDQNDSVLSVEVLSMDQQMGNAPGGFGGSSEVTQGSSANTITEAGSYSDTTYTSTGDDENALRIDGAEVTLDGITVNKSAGETSNTENGDFYGVNAALLATNGANVTIRNATVTSDAQNGNGVFSYGEGTVVTISDSTITTTADNSGGIQTTGGGTTNAENLTVETSGNSSAAIRSDRGGGTVNVDGGTYTSNGYNSPAVYSTADITVKDATLTANNSEALVIEGKNSISLTDCDVTGNMSDTKGASSDENVHNVMIYQSMSGDADVGTSTFSMTGGSLTARNGDMFYITNTHCVLTLSGVELQNEDTDGYLLRVCGNSASHGWGTAGENGAQVEFTANDQVLEGDILVDSISTLNLTLSNGSEFSGTIQIADNEDGGTAVSDNAVVTVEEGCTWTLTGDCTISSLTNHGTINYNGHTITLADGTVLQ